MTLFSPKRADGRAEWKVVWDETTSLQFGDELPFTRLAELLETDDRQRICRAVRECNRHLLNGESPVPRFLSSVRGKGYRVIMPGDYASVAMAAHKSATRKLGGAVELMDAAPLEEMTPAARYWATQVSMVLLDHHRRLLSSDERQARAEARIARLEKHAGIGPPPVVPGQSEPLTTAEQEIMDAQAGITS
jgi:hypothetical protein